MTLSFYDDLQIIQNAVYGKEIRPAITDALMSSWGAVKSMTASVDELNKRVDNLPTGGGNVNPNDPDKPVDPTDKILGYYVGNAISCVNGANTIFCSVGEADVF